MSRLILLRHGESMWNRLNLFTGWVDVPLSEKGIEEARQAGKVIQDLPIDLIFVSTLNRSHMTAMLAMASHHSGKVPIFQHEESQRLKEWGQIHNPKSRENSIPVIPAWQLNERMYGELQGLNKTETAEQFGADQVKIWRRSFATAPPNGESLKLTAERSIPYFKERVLPLLKDGKNVFIAAHGNSLRSIIMELDGLSEEEVLSLEIATGAPILYQYQNNQFLKEDLSDASHSS